MLTLLAMTYIWAYTPVQATWINAMFFLFTENTYSHFKALNLHRKFRRKNCKRNAERPKCTILIWIFMLDQQIFTNTSDGVTSHHDFIVRTYVFVSKKDKWTLQQTQNVKPNHISLQTTFRSFRMEKSKPAGNSNTKQRLQKHGRCLNSPQYNHCVCHTTHMQVLNGVHVCNRHNYRALPPSLMLNGRFFGVKIVLLRQRRRPYTLNDVIHTFVEKGDLYDAKRYHFVTGIKVSPTQVQEQL